MIAVLLSNWRIILIVFGCAMASYISYGVGYDRADRKCQYERDKVEQISRKNKLQAKKTEIKIRSLPKGEAANQLIIDWSR